MTTISNSYCNKCRMNYNTMFIFFWKFASISALYAAISASASLFASLMRSTRSTLNKEYSSHRWWNYCTQISSMHSSKISFAEYVKCFLIYHEYSSPITLYLDLIFWNKMWFQTDLFGTPERGDSLSFQLPSIDSWWRGMCDKLCCNSGKSSPCHRQLIIAVCLSGIAAACAVCCVLRMNECS